MTRLRSKLGEAMRPRKTADVVEPARKDLDSRYDKADQVMADVAPDGGSVARNEPLDSQPVGPKPKGGNRVIRDTFSLPPSDYERIESLRSRARRKDVEVSKSEIMRAGLLALEALPVSEFLAVVGRLERIKTGRPEQPKPEQRKRSA